MASYLEKKGIFRASDQNLLSLQNLKKYDVLLSEPYLHMYARYDHDVLFHG